MPIIKINGHSIELVRKKIKNIYLRVYPGSGKIKISAPQRMSEVAIYNFAISKSEWLIKQLAKTQSVKRKPHIESKKYISGEKHYFAGTAYELKVFIHSAKPRIILTNKVLELYVRSGSNAAKREKVLNEWYRSQLKRIIPDYISKWENAMKVKVKEFGVKSMKTRWGTCNRTAGRIWLNLQLAKYRPECLEYIVVHEMIHLIERKHNKRFYALMDKFLPDWKKLKRELSGLGR